VNMPDATPGNRGRNRQKVPRIGREEAARVFAQCEQLLDGSTLFVENLRQMGFARFLAPLNEQVLELAVQPDAWGERTRARLISHVFAGLRDFLLNLRVWRKSCRYRMLSSPAFSSNSGVGENISRSNSPTIPAILAHALSSAPARPIRSIPSTVAS
jgi:hypothetical protein